MRVLRFMSANEALKLRARVSWDGPSIKNTANHSANGSSSNSIGFCFAVDNTDADEREAIYNHSTYLSGVVHMDVCLIGELRQPVRRAFKKSRGRYSSGYRDELCVQGYSLNDFLWWAMYTPNRADEGLVKNMPLFSGNWRKPVGALSHYQERNERELQK